jgi:hypothetical protein
MDAALLLTCDQIKITTTLLDKMVDIYKKISLRLYAANTQKTGYSCHSIMHFPRLNELIEIKVQSRLLRIPRTRSGSISWRGMDIIPGDLNLLD